MLAPALAAQQAEPLRLSVTTRLVQVSVVVLDGKGRPANGLTKDDFTVLDNGKPQVITGFFRSGGERAAAAPRRPRDPAAPPTWSNRGQSTAEMPRTVTALLFDGLNTNMKDQDFVKQKMLRFLRNLREGDSAALYLLSSDLRILHDFTSDSKSLIAALEDHRPKILAQWTRETVRGGSMRGVLRKDRASFTLSALRAIGEHLSRIPGRKNLVWVTSGFPMLIAEREKNSPGYMHSMIPEMQADRESHRRRRRGALPHQRDGPGGSAADFSRAGQHRRLRARAQEHAGGTRDHPLPADRPASRHDERHCRAHRRARVLRA